MVCSFKMKKCVRTVIDLHGKGVEVGVSPPQTKGDGAVRSDGHHNEELCVHLSVASTHYSKSRNLRDISFRIFMGERI